MMLKSRVTGFISAMVIAGSAAAHLPMPPKCPSADAIKQEGVSMIIDWDINVYVTTQISTFDTNQRWFFSLGFIEADSKRAALKIGNKLLINMSGNPVPEQNNNDAWVCNYHMNGDYRAFALITDDFPVQKIRKLLSLNKA